MLDLLFNGGEVIGFIAAFLTTIAFIPQVFKVLKTKSVEGLSLTTYLLYVSGVLDTYRDTSAELVGDRAAH